MALYREGASLKTPRSGTGWVVSALGLLLGLVQYRRISSLKIERQRTVWMLLRPNKAMLRHLEREDVQQAYGLASEQFRGLLEEGSSQEKRCAL